MLRPLGHHAGRWLLKPEATAANGIGVTGSGRDPFQVAIWAGFVAGVATDPAQNDEWVR
jgi:hypothetical protein